MKFQLPMDQGHLEVQVSLVLLQKTEQTNSQNLFLFDQKYPETAFWKRCQGTVLTTWLAWAPHVRPGALCGLLSNSSYHSCSLHLRFVDITPTLVSGYEKSLKFPAQIPTTRPV